MIIVIACVTFHDIFYVTQRRHLSSDDKTTEFGKITQNNGHYAVKGHSRSPIFVPMESSYATSY